MKEVLNVRLEKISSIRTVLGVFIILCSLIAFTQKPFAGLLFLVTGLIIIFGYKGASLDRKRNRAREMTSILGLHFGKWNSMKDYKFLLLSSGGGRKNQYGNFQLYLVALDKNKHQSILLCDSVDRKFVEQNAHDYANFMSLEIRSNLKAQKLEDMHK